MNGGRNVIVAVVEEQVADRGLAKADRVFQYRTEYRLELARRRTDDTQHIGRCGLLLQGLAQFVEQPRVLDGDDGLIGEGRHQLDLFVRKRPFFLAIDDDGTDQLVSLSIGTHSKVCAPPKSTVATRNGSPSR